jgi:hypothetical protein
MLDTLPVSHTPLGKPSHEMSGKQVLCVLYTMSGPLAVDGEHHRQVS